MIKKYIKNALLFLGGNAAVFIAMYYLTWGSMGFFEAGDFWGMTRFYGVLGGTITVVIWWKK